MMKKLNNLSARHQILLLAAVIIGLRLALAWIFGVEVADLAQYHLMSDIIERGENIYTTAGLFHYTPLPMFLPAWSSQVAQALGLPFHFVVKWPMILADAGIAVLLWWQAQKRGLPKAALWLGLGYAFNPVSLLTTSFHGSYSVLPAFFTVLAYCLVSCVPAKRYYLLAALNLGLAIGLRGYPVLFLPFFLRKINLDWRRKGIFLILAGLPSIITLLPFLMVDLQSVWQGVFAYSGVTDYGWIASLRAYWLITTGNHFLPGILATELVGFSRWLFLIAYALLTVVFWRKHERFSLLSGILGTLLLFFGLYGGISSQYLIWAVPFALIVGSGWAAAYTWSATASLISFYLYYFPAVLFGQLPVVWPELNLSVMPFNLVFNTAFWGICLVWLIRLIIRPIPDRVLPAPDIHPPGSTPNRPPLRAWVLASRNQKLARVAELSLVAYIGLVFVLEINLLAPQVFSQPLQELNLSTRPLRELKVTTVWLVGNSGSGPGEISAPLGLAVDKAGQIYLADRGNHRVQQFSADGTVVATWDGASSTEAPFEEPSDIAIDAQSGLVWVLDAGNGWIYRLGTDGKMEAVIDGARLQMYKPRGLAISSSGDIFVADTGGGRILHLDQQGNVKATWGQPGSGSNQFQDPTGIVIRDNDLFVVDVNNRRVVHYTLDGKQVGAFRTGEGSTWLDADDLGHIFVSSAQTQEIFVYDFSGTLISELTPEKEIPRLAGLAGIATTQDGHLYAVGAAQLSQVKIEWD